MAFQLILHLKKEYFEQIERGEKTEEYLLRSPYWAKRLVGKKYKNICLKCGYAKPGRKSREIRRKFNGWHPSVVNHPQFGNRPVHVFAIDLSRK